MKVPVGFRFAGAHAGLKPVRRDVALVVSDTPAVAAGCFTQNRAAAAPVIDARARVPSSTMRAVVINSGNANALTGAGRRARCRRDPHARRRQRSASPPTRCVTASTGVIGVRLPAQKIVAGDARARRVAHASRRSRPPRRS